MGARERTPEGVILYRLGDAAAARRARAMAAVGALASLAPVALAAVLLDKLDLPAASGVAFWFVAGFLGLLVGVRAAVGYGVANKRLRALVVTVEPESIRMQAGRLASTVERAAVARIVEIGGPLGGLRVDSTPDARTGAVSVVRVPRGGDAFGEVRERLEQWRPVERRGRRPVVARLALGIFVVAAIFFLPFVLDDFVARSRVLAALAVAAMWLAVRRVLRTG
jgi:hypothetical protein